MSHDHKLFQQISCAEDEEQEDHDIYKFKKAPLREGPNQF